MIISHKHKFIFIKTEKTGGTSMEIALSHSCGQEDVITQISPRDEAIRTEVGARGPQNYRVPFGKCSRRDWARFAVRRSRPQFANHHGASFIKGHVDPDVWNSYFKFCFERNPWDKVMSYYYFRPEPRPSLTDFVQAGGANCIRGFDLYTIDGEIVVDRVCRFEQLSDELEEVAGIVGLPVVPSLPRAKARTRPAGTGYREALSELDKAKVSQVYAREIAYFGYRW